MIRRLKKIFLYGNTEKEIFERIYPNVVESGRKNLLAFSAIVIIAMAAMYIASFYNSLLTENRPFYMICLLTNLILAVVVWKFGEKNELLILIGIYIFVGMLLGFGIALGTRVEPDEPTVSFLIILFAVPLLFTDMPIRMDLCIIAGVAAYILAASKTQTQAIFDYNMASVIPYGLLSLVVCTYMMTIKIRRLVLEYENKFLSESDQLTGMLNRRCYEQKIDYFRVNGCMKGMMIWAFDINGLKMVNDNLGHPAGDELIRGAADCITGVFSAYGHCYRIGGDEFIAILDGAAPSNDELKSSLLSRCRCFHGIYVSGLSISAGMATAESEERIEDLIRRADQSLYEDKARYYRQNGIDRRRP